MQVSEKVKGQHLNQGFSLRGQASQHPGPLSLKDVRRQQRQQSPLQERKGLKRKKFLLGCAWFISLS